MTKWDHISGYGKQIIYNKDLEIESLRSQVAKLEAERAAMEKALVAVMEQAGLCCFDSTNEHYHAKGCATPPALTALRQGGKP